MNRRTHSTNVMLALLLAMIIGPSSASALENLGLIAGFDRANLEGDEPSGFKFQPKTGYVVCAAVEFAVGRDLHLSLQPGFRHTETGIGYKDRQSGVVQDSLLLKADWLVLPVLLRIGGKGAFFATGGFDFAMAMSGGLEGGQSGAEIQDIVRDLDVAAVVGVGFEVPAGRFRITGEWRYRQGLINASQNVETEDEAIPARFRFSGWQLQAGLLLPMGGP